MNAKATQFFSTKNISVYALFDDQWFNDTLTNDVVSFEELGPDWTAFTVLHYCWQDKTGKRNVQGVLQAQDKAHPRHEEEVETDKTKQAKIEQTREKHRD